MVFPPNIELSKSTTMELSKTLQMISDRVFIELVRIFLKTEILTPKEIAQLSEDVDLVENFKFDSSRLLQVKLVLESNFKIQIRCLHGNSNSVKLRDVVNQIIVHSNDDLLFRWLDEDAAGAA